MGESYSVCVNGDEPSMHITYKNGWKVWKKDLYGALRNFIKIAALYVPVHQTNKLMNRQD